MDSPSATAEAVASAVAKPTLDNIVSSTTWALNEGTEQLVTWPEEGNVVIARECSRTGQR